MHHHGKAFGTISLAAVKAMPPLKTEKNEFAALAAGLFGAIGNGLYLRSWKDAGLSLAINVGFTIAVPGVGFFPSLLVSAAYGFLRVKYSNEKLRALAAAPPAAAIVANDVAPAKQLIEQHRPSQAA